MQAEKQIANVPSVTRQGLQFILGAALIAFLLFSYYFYTWHNAYNFRSAMDVCAQPFEVWYWIRQAKNHQPPQQILE